jgi:hypothetical protein
MQKLLSFRKFSNRLDEAHITKHFYERAYLRVENLAFESGVEGLDDRDLDFSKKQIVSYVNSCVAKLKNFDLSNYMADYHRNIFTFGDIVLKKGENYFYPVFKVSRYNQEELAKKNKPQEYYFGSVYCAAIMGEKVMTIIVFPRKCQYKPEKLCNPINKDFIRNYFYDSYIENNDSRFSLKFFDEEFPNQNLSEGVKIIEIPEVFEEPLDPENKMRILRIEQEKREKEEWENKTETEKFLQLSRGEALQFKVVKGRVLSYLKKSGEVATGEIEDYQKQVENGKLTGLRIYFKPEIPGSPKIVKIIVPGERIVMPLHSSKRKISSEGEELGFNSYVATVEKITDTKYEGLVIRSSISGAI